MAGKISSLLQVVLPKSRSTKVTALTNTHDPRQGKQILSLPAYREHLNDLATSRLSYDSRVLLQDAFRTDPDMSAAVNAYLTVADTLPLVYVRDPSGQFDLPGHQLVMQIVQSLTSRVDYSNGFELVKGLRSLCADLRYMILLRGGAAVELVLNKVLAPSRFNTIDLGTIEWQEPSPGQFLPWQRPKSGGNLIDLSRLPTFFVTFFRQDPTSIYSYSPFVSAINTIVARQQVINELYRIMQVTGFPRITLEVAEEILLKSAPANIKQDAQALRTFINARLQEIANTFSTIRSDQPFVHTDAVKPAILNEKTPGMAVDISHVINVLNAQNQAALKTMATIIGRGESGVNTASVEARIFSMNADQLNVPVGELLSQILTFCLRLQGNPGSVEVQFREAELRSRTELEPQMTLMAARLKEDLSLGVIDDIEYHMIMHGRPPATTAPKLSGTGFMKQSNSTSVTDTTNPNDTPLGRSQTGEGKKATSLVKSNGVK